MEPQHPHKANTSNAEPETATAAGSRSAGVGPISSNEPLVIQEWTPRRDTHADTTQSGSATSRSIESTRTAPFDPIRDAAGQNERKAVEPVLPGVPLYQPPQPKQVKGKGKTPHSQGAAEAPELDDEPELAGSLRDRSPLTIGGRRKDLSPEPDAVPENGDEEAGSNFEPDNAESNSDGEDEDDSDPKEDVSQAAPSSPLQEAKQKRTSSSSTPTSSKKSTKVKGRSPGPSEQTPNQSKMKSAIEADLKRLKGYNKTYDQLSDESVEDVEKGQKKERTKMRNLKRGPSYWDDMKDVRRKDSKRRKE